MCGRYYFSQETTDNVRSLACHVDKTASFPTGDIHPSELSTILIGQKPGIYATDMRWGFPFAQSKRLVINARAETVFDKRSFSDSMRSRRCVIPAQHFYEWDRSKQMVTFTVPDREIILMAGIWNRINEVNCFTILTTAANDSMKPVHDRMPVILSAGMIQDWLYNPIGAKEMLTREQPVLSRRQDFEQLTIF